jgi:hypothetical protein
MSWDYATTNVTIQNSDLVNLVTDDNAGAVYIDANGASEIVVRNNRIHGYIQGGVGNNVSNGVKIFRAGNVTIENNEIYNLVYGVNYKHNNPGTMVTIVQNNVIHDVSKGFQWIMHNALIANNVVYRAGIGIKLFEVEGGCDDIGSDGNQLVHNTFVDVTSGIWLETEGGACPGATNTLVKDNLVFNFTDSAFRGVAVYPYNATVDTSLTTLDHNLVYSPSFSQPVRVLSTFYGVTGLPSSVRGGGNITGAPNFASYNGRDYTLVSGAGKGAASDGTDIGARTCAAGVNATCSGSGAPSPGPMPPSGLRIVSS